MIKQKFIDTLVSQKNDFLIEKKKLSFLKRIFFRKYTDWVLTDIISEYEGQKAYGTDEANCVKIGKPYYFNKQTQVRMKLSDGSIEQIKIRI